MAPDPTGGFDALPPRRIIGPGAYASFRDKQYGRTDRPQDPARGVPSLPPNAANFIVPHVQTFQGFVSTVSNAYRPSDEAVRDSRENARWMRNDPALMGPVEARQRAVALLNWHLEPEDPDSTEQKELCERLTKLVKMTPRFTEFRRSTLDAIWYGRAAQSLRWGWKVKGGKKAIVITGWKPVHGDKLVFRFDTGDHRYTDDQMGIKVGLQWKAEDLAGYRRPEPTDFGLAYFLKDWERSYYVLHKHFVEDGAYEDPRQSAYIHGVGIRSRIYWLDYQRKEALAMLMEIMERTGLGFNIWYYPAGDASAEKSVDEAIVNQTQQNNLKIPRMSGDPAMDAYGFDRIEPSGQGISTMREIVDDYFGDIILRYILGQTLSMKSDATGLGSGVADLHYESLMQIVRYDADNLEETLTRDLVTPLKNFNFPSYIDTDVHFRIDTESPDSVDKITAALQVWQMGGKISEQNLRDITGLSKPESDEDTLTNPEIEASRMMMEQQGMAMQQPVQQGASVPMDIEQEDDYDYEQMDNSSTYTEQPIAYARKGHSQDMARGVDFMVRNDVVNRSRRKPRRPFQFTR